MSKKSYILSILLILITNSFGQSIEDRIANFSRLYSEGSLPEDFLGDPIERNNKFIQEYLSDSLQQDKKAVNYLLSTHFYADYTLRSGDILTGDPVTQYINEVLDKVMRFDPKLKEEVRAYVFKSASVNAFTRAEGILYMNIGLIAKCKTESQLAFVLAHEASHYILNHSFDSHFENLDILKGTRRTMSNDQRIDSLLSRNRDDEFEADSLAFVIMSQSEYGTKDINDGLRMLHYSYLPIEEEPWSANFFNNGNFQVPACYLKAENDTIEKIKVKESDQYYTHPNILSRIMKLDAYNFRLGSSIKPVKESSSKFKIIRDLARFEFINSCHKHHNYTDALYTAYVLFQEYPENEFIRKSIAKSLYALAKFKVTGNFHYATTSYTKKEGESQQLYYLLRKLNKRALVAIALHNMYHTIQQYPEDLFLKDLFNDLVFESIDYELFDFEIFKDPSRKTTYESDAFVIPDVSNKEGQIAAKTAMKKYKNFYWNAFDANDINSYLFQDAFEYAKKEKQRLVDKENLFLKKKGKFERFQSQIKGKKAIALVPTSIFIKGMKRNCNCGKFKIDLTNSFANTQKIENALRTAQSNILNGPISVESVRELKINDTETLNKAGVLNNWINQRAYLDTEKRMVPISSDEIANKGYADNNTIILKVSSHSFMLSTHIKIQVYDFKTGERLALIKETIGFKNFNEKYVSEILTKLFNTSNQI